MSGQDLLHLQWKNQLPSIHFWFSQLFTDTGKNFGYDDATVACGGKLYPVHRMVLSLCSEYFSDMFAAAHSTNRHPIIFLKDIPSDIFEILLRFIYLGEVHVEREKFTSLLSAGESLKIKGLIQHYESLIDDVIVGKQTPKRGQKRRLLTTDGPRTAELPQGTAPLPKLQKTLQASDGNTQRDLAAQVLSAPRCYDNTAKRRVAEEIGSLHSQNDKPVMVGTALPLDANTSRPLSLQGLTQEGTSVVASAETTVDAGRAAVLQSVNTTLQTHHMPLEEGSCVETITHNNHNTSFTSARRTCATQTSCNLQDAPQSSMQDGAIKTLRNSRGQKLDSLNNTMNALKNSEDQTQSLPQSLSSEGLARVQIVESELPHDLNLFRDGHERYLNSLPSKGKMEVSTSVRSASPQPIEKIAAAGSISPPCGSGVSSVIMPIPDGLKQEGRQSQCLQDDACFSELNSASAITHIPRMIPASSLHVVTPVTTLQLTACVGSSQLPTPVNSSDDVTHDSPSLNVKSVNSLLRATKICFSSKQTSVSSSPERTSVRSLPIVTSVSSSLNVVATPIVTASQIGGSSPRVTLVAASPEVTPVASSPEVTPVASSPEVTPVASSPEVTPVASSQDETLVVSSNGATPVVSSPGEIPAAFSPEVAPRASSPEVAPRASSPEVAPSASSPEAAPAASSPEVSPVGSSAKATSVGPLPSVALVSFSQKETSVGSPVVMTTVSSVITIACSSPMMTTVSCSSVLTETTSLPVVRRVCSSPAASSRPLCTITSTPSLVKHKLAKLLENPTKMSLASDVPSEDIRSSSTPTCATPFNYVSMTRLHDSTVHTDYDTDTRMLDIVTHPEPASCSIMEDTTTPSLEASSSTTHDSAWSSEIALETETYGTLTPCEDSFVMNKSDLAMQRSLAKDSASEVEMGCPASTLVMPRATGTEESLTKKQKSAIGLGMVMIPTGPRLDDALQSCKLPSCNIGNVFETSSSRKSEEKVVIKSRSRLKSSAVTEEISASSVQTCPELNTRTMQVMTTEAGSNLFKFDHWPCVVPAEKGSGPAVSSGCKIHQESSRRNVTAPAEGCFRGAAPLSETADSWSSDEELPILTGGDEDDTQCPLQVATRCSDVLLEVKEEGNDVAEDGQLLSPPVEASQPSASCSINASTSCKLTSSGTVSVQKLSGFRSTLEEQASREAKEEPMDTDVSVTVADANQLKNSSTDNSELFDVKDELSISLNSINDDFFNSPQSPEDQKNSVFFQTRVLEGLGTCDVKIVDTESKDLSSVEVLEVKLVVPENSASVISLPNNSSEVVPKREVATLHEVISESARVLPSSRQNTLRLKKCAVVLKRLDHPARGSTASTRSHSPLTRTRNLKCMFCPYVSQNKNDLSAHWASHKLCVGNGNSSRDSENWIAEETSKTKYAEPPVDTTGKTVENTPRRLKSPSKPSGEQQQLSSPVPLFSSEIGTFRLNDYNKALNLLLSGKQVTFRAAGESSTFQQQSITNYQNENNRTGSNRAVVATPKVEPCAKEAAAVAPKTQASPKGAVVISPKTQASPKRAAFVVTPKIQASANAPSVVTQKTQTSANEALVVTPKFLPHVVRKCPYCPYKTKLYLHYLSHTFQHKK